MMKSFNQNAEGGMNADSAKKGAQSAMDGAQFAKNGAQSAKKEAEQVFAFENPEFGKVRTAVGMDGEPLFCAKDVCDALGYKRASDAVNQHVRSSDTVKHRVARIAKNRYGLCVGKVQIIQMIFVNESGFYALVLGSKLDSALRFKDWVTSVVLPQIRLTGGYLPVHPGESEEETIRNAEEVLRATLKEKEHLLEVQKKLLDEQKEKLHRLNVKLGEHIVQLHQQKEQLHQQKVQMAVDRKLIVEQDGEIRRLNGVVDEQVVQIASKGENIIALERQVDGLMPKALYSDNVLDSVSCFTTTQVAKELGITAQELNRSLCSLHIQYYQSGQYMLYADYAHMGLAKSRTRFCAKMRGNGDGDLGQVRTKLYLVWTEKGRKFIHDLAQRCWDLAGNYEVRSLG